MHFKRFYGERSTMCRVPLFSSVVMMKGSSGTPGGKTGTTGEMKEETREETKEEMREETKEETREETKEETREETKEETREETKKETKEEMKEEMKEEAIEETIEETKEEMKEEMKEKMKEETKEETMEMTQEIEDETGTDGTMVRADSDQTGIETETIGGLKRVTKDLTGIQEDVTQREKIGIDVVLVIAMTPIAKIGEMRDRRGKVVREQAVLGDVKKNLQGRNVKRPKKTGRMG